MSESLLYETGEAVARITLNRPEKKNACNAAMASAMIDALQKASADESVRCIVITGSGQAFCAGQDLEETGEGAANDHILEKQYHPIIEAIVSMPKPVLAAVNGVAAGAGASIALACDLIIASRQASFVQAFSAIGLVPDSGGTFFLPRLAGSQRAFAQMMLSERVSADDAAQMGMIWKAVDPDQFPRLVEDTAAKLAAVPALAARRTKELVRASPSNTIKKQMALEEKFQKELFRSQEFAAAREKFLSKSRT